MVGFYVVNSCFDEGGCLGVGFGGNDFVVDEEVQDVVVFDEGVYDFGVVVVYLFGLGGFGLFGCQYFKFDELKGRGEFVQV